MTELSSIGLATYIEMRIDTIDANKADNVTTFGCPCLCYRTPASRLKRERRLEKNRKRSRCTTLLS
jgi:hypothetical protein